MTIERALIADLPEVLELQRAAYQSEARLYDDYSIPPMTQTLAELCAEFGRSTFLKALAADRIIGSVRSSVNGDTCHVGRLIVHPNCQGRGIGTRLMAAIEALAPAVRRFELFTGHASEGNLRLYERLGYRRFREEQIKPGLTFIYLEKEKSPVRG